MKRVPWNPSNALATHDFDREDRSLPGHPREDFRCRRCGRAFRFADGSYETWAIARDGSALAGDVTDRWTTQPCAGQPSDGDAADEKWLKSASLPHEAEVEIGRAVVVRVLEELVADVELPVGVEWRADFDVGHGPGIQPASPTVHSLGVTIGPRRFVAKFTDAEITDCVSEGKDGRELRVVIRARLKEVVDRLLGAKPRIGF